MRTTLSLLLSLFFIAPNVRAQDCVVQSVPSYYTGDHTVGGYMPSISAFAEDGLVAIIEQGNGLNDVLVARIDASGAVRWRTLLATTDPTIELTRPQVLAGPDGRCFVYGTTRYKVQPNAVEVRFHNQYIIALSASGSVEWARYYGASSSPYFAPVCAVLADGDLLLAQTWDQEESLGLTRLDAQGVPIWTKRFGVEEYGYTRVECLAVGPGDQITLGGALQDFPVLIRTDGQGALSWVKRFVEDDYITLLSNAIVHRANGDLLVVANYGVHAGQSGTSIIRFGEDGTFLSNWFYDRSGTMDQIRELPDGGLFLAVGHHSFGEPPIALKLASSGAVMGAWELNDQSPIQPTLRRTASLGNADTLVLGFTDPTGNRILRAAHYDDLSCGLSAINVSMTEAAPPTLVTTIDEEAASILKSWTMSLQGPPHFDGSDLAVSLASTSARPGFVNGICASVTNVASDRSGSSELTMVVDPSLVYQAAVPAPDLVAGNVLTWNVDETFDLFETRAFNASFLVPATTPLGTLLTSTISVTQDSTEVTLANNTATWTQEVTGSYDPNDKLVRPEGMYHFANDSILDYTIRFQNTGTDTAFTVVVVDTLSADLDVSTFRAGASSHPYTYTLNGGGLLTFTFANILLPDSNVNEAASHGLVKFTIKPHAPLEMGHAFVNRAYIYFDFNEPIITPDAVTVVGLPQGAAELDGLRPHLYPVPVRNELTVVLPDGARVLSAQVLTPDGRRMAVQPSFQGDRTVVPVAHLPAGLHFLHLMDRQGRSHVARFVKE